MDLPAQICFGIDLRLKTENRRLVSVFRLLSGSILGHLTNLIVIPMNPWSIKNPWNHMRSGTIRFNEIVIRTCIGLPYLLIYRLFIDSSGKNNFQYLYPLNLTIENVMTARVYKAFHMPKVVFFARFLRIWDAVPTPYAIWEISDY